MPELVERDMATRSALKLSVSEKSEAARRKQEIETIDAGPTCAVDGLLKEYLSETLLTI